ncbi:MAG: YraN family protein [Chitinophagaceae bacterium]|nr:YraN family protein [Chitinophagaceae bacterium]
MARHNQTGHIGEELAVSYFNGLHYQILHRNWRHGRFEVDLVAEKEGILHFIEVKTRRTLTFGHPEELVDEKKITNLIAAAEEYLYLWPQWQRIQFDILAITMIPDQPVEYFLIEDVYL